MVLFMHAVILMNIVLVKFLPPPPCTWQVGGRGGRVARQHEVTMDSWTRQGERGRKERGGGRG